ncbi:GntR family transcriptional regulator [Chelativorans salis]|uniref:GntR family transcriptional regulator n=1 Tax=Chelativorans salis TaxID=2978478 RepID=A0ABT2LTQ1_9HYPH|nr:GntR family transcriptional regulator [Chelativorans sp. EGI FJ00035]MCT7377910.1 GntR family transcriptional regulator [Chelativorans sp. EGI FJ00035]
MLRSRLKNKIADLILSGHLKPGQRLDEQSLASRFGVSRTPIREALQQLGAAGLVEMRPRRSARVRALSMPELESSFEAMGEIEAICARYAAERMTQAERIALKALIDHSRRASEEGDRLRCRDLDAQIHALLHTGAHNGALCSVANEMRVRVELYSSAPYTLPNFETQLHVPHRQHEQIVQAVLDRDAEAAHCLMIEHIGRSFLTVKGILEEEGSALASVHGGFAVPGQAQGKTWQEVI